MITGCLLCGGSVITGFVFCAVGGDYWMVIVCGGVVITGWILCVSGL